MEYSPPADAWVFHGGLSKFHAAKLIFQAHPELLEARQFAFLDPDIIIDHRCLVALMQRGEAQGRGIYQAAVSHQSSTFWDILYQQPAISGWQETSFVEVMAPCFSAAALKRCLPRFDASISTWGLDFLWFDLCHDLSMGVYHDLTMTHPTEVDTVDGPFYRYLQSRGIDPHREVRLIRQEMAWLYYPCNVPAIFAGRLKKPYVYARRLLSLPGLALRKLWRALR